MTSLDGCYIMCEFISPIKNHREITINYKGVYRTYLVSLEVPNYLMVVYDLIKKEVDGLLSELREDSDGE